jgi:hypothetical protein
MKKMILTAVFLVFLSTLIAQADSRIALVIGNAAYTEVPTLKNSVNDARDIGAALKRLGWRTIEVFNGDRKAMLKAVNAFRDALKGSPGSTALFYYAGHGVQIDGKNYLLPLGEEFEGPDDVKIGSMALDDLMAAYDEGEALTCLTILDACRENPFAKAKTRAIGSTRGLSVVPAVEAEGGSATIFATGAGDVAQDGAGRNGVFTEALLKHIEENKSLGDIFVATAKDVKKATGGKQNPYINSSGIISSIYLNDPEEREKAAAAEKAKAEAEAKAVARATAPTTGKLKIETDVAGVAYFGDALLGTAGPDQPLVADGLAPGTAKIRLVPDDNGPELETSAEINAGGTSSVSFKRTYSASDRFILSVEGPVPEMAVMIDGVLIGYTPHMTDLAAGSHKLELIHYDYETYEETVTGSPGQRVEVVARPELSLPRQRAILEEERQSYVDASRAKVRKGSLGISANIAGWTATAAGAVIAAIAIVQSESIYNDEYMTTTDPLVILDCREQLNGLNAIYRAGLITGLAGLGTGIFTLLFLPNTKTEQKSIQELDQRIQALTEE